MIWLSLVCIVGVIYFQGPLHWLCLLVLVVLQSVRPAQLMPEDTEEELEHTEEAEEEHKEKLASYRHKFTFIA